MALDMTRYENVLRKQTGKAIRPHRFDGYINMINRYGTKKDDTEQYHFEPEPVVDDALLEMFYENNGLFAKIIDTPAEEAVKHGFTLEGVEDEDIIKFYQSALEELDWEEVAMTGIKWARLFGGSLAVMLINDGHALEEPLDWRHIQSIDDILIFDRSMVYSYDTNLYEYEPDDPFRTRGSRLGTPEWYEINSPTGGNFTVHDSRVLAFRNGILPYNTSFENYRLWGIPEYVRISRAVRNAEIAHESAPKMLSKSVQPVYKMKDLAMLLATEEGEDKVLRRLEAIDMARGLLNSVTIDSEGEDYSFQSFGFNGVSDVIDSSCNWLSALTSIPQTILFGRSPAGMNATGESDFENYYNFVERIQKRMLRSNLRYLLSIIFTAGLHTREVKEIPEFNVTFNPLWSMSETEETQLESQKLQNEMTRANLAALYIQNEVLDPKEVRVQLGKEDDFDVESMLDDMTEEEIIETAPKGQQEGMGGGMEDMAAMMGGGQPAEENPQQNVSPENYAEQGNAPESAPEATKLPQDQEEDPDHEDEDNLDDDWITVNGTHVLIDDQGNAQSGGKLKGQNFGKAKSQKSGGSASENTHPQETESSETNVSSADRKPVQGKDISGSYDGEKDIKSVIHAQGFDGLPRLASQEEFDKAVKASSFIAQRSYSASSSEILEEYQNQLYNGEWYVECTTGGAQYGQGMYCAADYNGELTKGIKKEMDHYSSRYSTLSTDQEYVVFTQMSAMRKELIAKYGEEEGGKRFKVIDRLSPEEFVRKYPERFKGLDLPCSRIETFTLDPDAKVISYDDVRSIQYGTGTEFEEKHRKSFMRSIFQEKVKELGLNNEEAAYLKTRLDIFEDDEDEEKARDILKSINTAQRNEIGQKYRESILTPIREAYYDRVNASREMDTGAFAALLGYDAINAGGHGESGSYTVILNRSKCIFLADDNRTDAEDESMITFKLGENGKIDAIRDGKVIGWVMTQESGESDHEDAESKDLNWITTENGVHIPLDDSGKAVGGPLAGTDFSGANSVKGAESKKESAFTPKRSDYVTEYEDEYSGKIKLEDAPPEDQFTYWKEMNMDKLRELYNQEKEEAKKRGEKGPRGDLMARREWYGFQTSKVSEDIHYIDDEYEADEILSNYISPSTFEGWFRAYDSNYKPRVVNGLIATPEARNAALSLMYKNYQNNGGDLGFEEFLSTPIKMYRGGHGQEHIDDDVFSSYTFNKKVADKFAGKDGRVYEAEIRPIDTWGSVNTIGESEIMVPSWIAPNGNVDSLDEEETNVDEGPASESELYKNVEDVESEEWLDDDILRRIRSVGVFVLNSKQGKILTGTRKDPDHFGQLCGPGGHVEPGESLTDAAIRETEEEFGVTPLNLKLLGLGDYEEDTGLIPAVFLCTEYEGNMITADFEMENQRFRTLPDIYSYDLFPPFKNSLQILWNSLTNVAESGIIKDEEANEINDDGAPVGNQNAAGPHNGGGLSNEEKEKIKKRFVGYSTHDGIKITGIWEHAFDRMGSRKISKGRIQKMLDGGTVSPGKTPNRQCYDIPGSRLVLDTKTGEIVTVMWR